MAEILKIFLYFLYYYFIYGVTVRYNTGYGTFYIFLYPVSMGRVNKVPVPVVFTYICFPIIYFKIKQWSIYGPQEAAMIMIFLF